jgi:hypothetical protein
MTVLPPTNSPPPDKVEQLVSEHLQRTLESQRGRAVAAFRAQMKAGGVAPGVIGFDEARRASVRMLRIWAGAASALAACLAIVVTMQYVRQPEISGSGRPATVQQASAPMMDQVELSREVDGGTRMLQDDTPVQVVREQTLRQTQWFDPNEKATYSVTEPIEKVGYVRIQPY